MDYEWYKWYPGLFRADTMHLSAEQDGIYRRLIDHYMETRQPLPDNDAALARIAGVTPDAWAIAAAIVRPFFTPCDGQRLRHKRCDDTLSEQDGASHKQSVKGKAGAAKRWGNRADPKGENANGHAHAIALAKPGDGKREEKRREEKGSKNPPTPLPEWLPVPEWEAFKEMRKKLKAPLGNYAEQLALRDLAKLREQGHDPKAVIDQSILRSWKGLFPVKTDTTKGTTHGKHTGFAKQDYFAGTEGFEVVGGPDAAA